jgi:hypothetical protein
MRRGMGERDESRVRADVSVIENVLLGWIE